MTASARFDQRWWLLLPAVAFFAIGMLRLNDLSLYTDSTRYVIWGSSLGEGHGWIDETQPEPESYVVNAPFYPVLLAPVLALAPKSLIAAKVLTLLFGVAAILLFGLWLQRSYGITAAMIGAFLFALNPMMLVISTEALSEAPYLLGFACIMLAVDRWLQDDNRTAMVALALLLPFLPLLREIAITLSGAILLVALSRREFKFSAGVILATAGLLGIWMYRNLVLVGVPATSQSSNVNFIFEHVLTPATASTVEELAARFLLNVKGFGFQLGGMLLYSLPQTLIQEPTAVFKAVASSFSVLKYAVFAIVPIIMAAGLVRDFMTSISAQVRFLFILAYAAVIFVYPIHDVRFLLPLLPLIIYYLLGGARWGAPYLRLKQPFRRVIIVGATIVVLIPNMLCLYEILRTNIEYRTDPGTVKASLESTSAHFYATPWREMGDWISRNTPDSATIASSAKEISIFIGDRKLLEVNDGVPTPMFETMLRDNAAAYVLAIGSWSDVTTYEFPMRESHRYVFEPVHQSGRMKLYRIRTRWCIPAVSVPGAMPAIDTTDAASLMRLGRMELLAGRYEESDRFFARAQARHRQLLPLLLYQRLIARTQNADSSGTDQVLAAMYVTNQSTPYLWAGRLHIGAMHSLIAARSRSDRGARAQQIYSNGRLLWDLGYRATGHRLVLESVQTDPGFFEGLMWAWHFTVQQGDTAGARPYLATLAAIDTSNAVVKRFLGLTGTWARLTRSGTPAERSILHVEIARLYQGLDLPEVALDETERAICEDPANSRARALYAELFRNKMKPRAEAAAVARLLPL